MTRRAFPALLLAAALLLTGCSAMLERSYVSVEQHNENPVSDGGSALRVESYQDLVSAVLYYVSRGQETGTIRFYNYDRDPDSDLDSACLEVAQEDPLGAYAVDYIQYELEHIVSYYEATISITYRRTAAQIASVVSVTGVTAIRTELGKALEQFSPEIVLKVGSFDEEAVDLQQLAREAYYATPLAAFGMPRMSFAIYPEKTSGRQRVVEVTLTYPEEVGVLRDKQDALENRMAAMEVLLRGLTGQEAARTAFAMVRENAAYLPFGGSSTAYGALVEGGADSEGFALAMKLLCDIAGVECTVVEGTRNGDRHFWNAVDWGSGTVAVDASDEAGFGLTEEQLNQRGYVRTEPGS